MTVREESHKTLDIDPSVDYSRFKKKALFACRKRSWGFQIVN